MVVLRNAPLTSSRPHLATTLLLAAALLAIGLWTPVAACARDDFFTAVDKAAAALRGLNAKNKPAYQAKLNVLRAKRNWDESAFLANAAPLVRDEKIAGYDAKVQSLLDSLARMGQEGGERTELDCGLLTPLRATLQALIEAQAAKWAYMFAKLDTELAK